MMLFASGIFTKIMSSTSSISGMPASLDEGGGSEGGRKGGREGGRGGGRERGRGSCDHRINRTDHRNPRFFWERPNACADSGYQPASHLPCMWPGYEATPFSAKCTASQPQFVMEVYQKV